MKKTVCFILFCIVVQFSVFCSEDILYSYDYNRYYTDRNDFVLQGGYQLKIHDYDFRNQKTYQTCSSKAVSSVFEIGSVQRRAKFSFYEDLDLVTREITLKDTKLDVSTSVLRFGAVRDFFFDTKVLPLTLSLGGGISGKIDNLSKTQNTYNSCTFSMGLSVKAQAAFHMSHLDGRYNLYLCYQPDFYLFSNAQKGKFAFTKNFRMDQSITAGLQVKLL